MPQADIAQANPYATFGTMAAEAPAEARLAFIRKTYTHLAAAIYGFVALEFFFFRAFDLDDLVPQILRFGSGLGWLVVLGAFCFVGYIADRWARSDTSPAMQYAGLLLYVFAEAVIFVPLLWIANDQSLKLEFGGGVQNFNTIAVAGVVTLLLFGVLTATVFITRKDFSFLAPALGIAAVVAFAFIIASAFGLFGGLGIGMAFSVFMVAFAGGYVLYYTSNILHHYRTDQHVAASLALFAAIALLFWYILQIILRFSSRD